MEQFENRLEEYKQYILSHAKNNKHAIISQLLFNENLISSPIENYVKKVKKFEGDSDFVIIVLIRMMYLIRTNSLSDPEIKTQLDALLSEVNDALREFPFWPPNEIHKKKSTDDIVFWSENHLFMTLGSYYLFRQHASRLVGDLSNNFENDLECKLLLKYLAIHCHESFRGVYEVNSHVYLPHSLSALWNLFDFAENPIVKSQAEEIIDNIVYQLMLGVDPVSGIGTFTASARAFPRTRLRSFGHNLNTLIKIMCGSNQAMEVTALSDFLITTNWRPKQTAFDALMFDGFLPQRKLSHETNMVGAIYGAVIESDETKVDEWTPLYWSAGLITHPKFATKTRVYQREKALQHNKHLWPVSFFFYSDTNFRQNMNQYEHFSAGQVYTGINYNIYKRPSHGLILSSFHLYNPHYCGFQQLPWFGNISGLPIWSQSGLGSESVAGFGIHNTHNPAVQQIGGLMLITYLTPDVLSSFIIRSLFSSKVRFFWPLSLFDSHLIKEYGKRFDQSNSVVQGKKSWNVLNFGAGPRRSSPVFPSEQEQLLLKSSKNKVWCIGRKNDVYVAVLCTQSIVVDDNDTDDAQFEYFNNEKIKCKQVLARLCCDNPYHSWIVITCTTQEFSSLESFVNEKLCNIDVQESVVDRIYHVRVLDGSSELEYKYHLDFRKQI